MAQQPEGHMGQGKNLGRDKPIYADVKTSKRGELLAEEKVTGQNP